MPSDNCIFCKIVNKDIPAKIVFEDSDVLAFEDIKPQAPIHVVIIPKTHISKLSDTKKNDFGLLGKMISAVNEIAKINNITKSGYRVIVNCGPDAGQAVLHLHMHLLGGRAMGWPPG